MSEVETPYLDRLDPGVAQRIRREVMQEKIKQHGLPEGVIAITTVDEIKAGGVEALND